MRDLRRALGLMGKLILLAKITSMVAGVATSLILGNLLLPHSLEHYLPSLPHYTWITSQLIIFTIFKLSTARKGVKSGASGHTPPPITAAATTATESDSPDLDAPSSTDGPTHEPVSPPDIDVIVEERGEAPGRLRKSNTWEGYCRRVAEAEAEAAVALRRLKRWGTFEKKAARKAEEDDAGLGRREELVAGNDELFQRVETFIKMHYDQLRLQRQQEVSRGALHPK